MLHEETIEIPKKRYFDLNKINILNNSNPEEKYLTNLLVFEEVLKELREENYKITYFNLNEFSNMFKMQIYHGICNSDNYNFDNFELIRLFDYIDKNELMNDYFIFYQEIILYDTQDEFIDIRETISNRLNLSKKMSYTKLMLLKQTIDNEIGKDNLTNKLQFIGYRKRDLFLLRLCYDYGSLSVLYWKNYIKDFLKQNLFTGINVEYYAS